MPRSSSLGIAQHVTCGSVDLLNISLRRRHDQASMHGANNVINIIPGYGGPFEISGHLIKCLRQLSQLILGVHWNAEIKLPFPMVSAPVFKVSMERMMVHSSR